jgi:TonB family protein
LSVVFHVAVTFGPSWSGPRRAVESVEVPAAPLSPEPAPIAVELPSVSEGPSIEREEPDPVGEVPPPPSGGTLAHPDTAEQGRGGDRASREKAINMADEDETVRLSPDLVSRLDRDQLQRLRAGRSRASWEDRRSTTQPAELTLVAVGRGRVRERRPPASWVPSRGALESPRPSVAGATAGTRAERDPEEGATAGAPREGSAREAPGAGLREAPAGTDHRSSAPVASARPSVVRAPVSVPAFDRSTPKDDVDTEQEVATTIRSIVHASAAGGPAGEGLGGIAGGGDPGFGGAAPAGFRAHPLGSEEGEALDFFTSDPRLVSYFRRIHAKIDPLWADAFPKSALLNLEQGTVILDFVVSADGRVEVEWPPVRPSGIDEFDRNCADAIRRASPLPPIPSVLGARLRIRAPFVVNNPVVK